MYGMGQCYMIRLFYMSYKILDKLLTRKIPIQYRYSVIYTKSLHLLTKSRCPFFWKAVWLTDLSGLVWRKSGWCCRRRNSRHFFIAFCLMEVHLSCLCRNDLFAEYRLQITGYSKKLTCHHNAESTFGGKDAATWLSLFWIRWLIE